MGPRVTQGNLLDFLGLGLSAVSWRPKDLTETEWIYVNAARCRMTGHSKDEIIKNSPFSLATRETKAQQKMIISRITAHGLFSLETTLIHKSGRVLPVRLDLQLVNEGESEFLLLEYHDISRQKKIEEELFRSRENTRDMLTLIEKEKQHLVRNIEGNLGLVAFPLIDQLRVSASKSQKSILNLLESRLMHMGMDLGISSGSRALSSNFTRRQMMICEMISEGMTSKEIALALDTALSTINNHRNLIRKKLGISGKPANLQAFLNQRT